MNSINKAAMVWSIAIVAVAVGFAFVGQSSSTMQTTTTYSNAFVDDNDDDANEMVLQHSDADYDDAVSDRKLQAQVLVERAIGLYHKVGTVAFSDFDTSEKFHDGELYVFVIDQKTATLFAHGATPGLVRTSLLGVTDPDGVDVGKLIRDTATDEGVWVKYKWSNPVNDKVQDKLSWIKSYDGYVFGVGVYAK